MPNKLFSSKKQAEAHARLEEVRGSGLYPFACCIEDPNSSEPYGVFDGPPESNYRPPDPVNTRNSQDEAMVARIADAILKSLAEKVQAKAESAEKTKEVNNGNPSPG
jgi:hypothetical protein